jgi:two-component system, LuxR family, response regulator FixJ
MANESLVHVIDDDDAVRDSLAFLLASAKLEVKTYESAAEFLKQIRDLGGGCIVTDVRMPDISGIDMLRRLRQQSISIPVIIMTGHGDIPLAVEAMKLGASDFFEKPFDDDELLEAVRNCLARQQGEEQRNAYRAKIQQNLATLSGRERQVLNGLVAGNPNKVIAFDHEISPRTVEIYRANVMTKMGAATLSELVRMAILGGLLDDARPLDGDK